MRLTAVVSLADNLRLEQPLRKRAAGTPTFAVETVRKALREQLGLDLTAARRTVDFLIVENAATASGPGR